MYIPYLGETTFFTRKSLASTGKSFSEALILVSAKRMFIEL